MCGIAGVASTAGSVSTEGLACVRDAMARRGPDDSGIWTSADHRVALAHRRLAVVDLTAAGHQPMISADGTLALTYNGEIYNCSELRAELAALGHEFRSTSDTEVLLAGLRAWGPQVVSKLVGMFAFAAYNAGSRTLLLARDRAGEKPLYYFARGGFLAFASDLGALLKYPSLPRELDPIGVECYLQLGYVPAPRSMLAGFSKLPPGGYLEFDVETGRQSARKYWRLPKAREAANVRATIGELADELDSLLSRAVSTQLVADVPVTVLLSGGLDSSLVVAFAAEAGAQLRTSSVRFGGFGPFDETAHARNVANYFGSNHEEVDAEELTPALLVEISQMIDEPIIDSSLLPTTLLCSTVRRSSTVALGGDGGDELFGGYMHYDRLRRIEPLSRLPVPRRVLRTAYEALFASRFRLRNWAVASTSDLRTEVPQVAQYFSRSDRSQMFGGRASVSPDKIWKELVSNEGDLISRATRTDFSGYLPGDILAKVDRASMFHSLEMRAPFLDHRVIEFAFSLVPSRLKVGEDGRKLLLRELARRRLPATFDARRKQGFQVPIGALLRTDGWRELATSVYPAANANSRSILMRSLLERNDSGYDEGERIFGLLMLELWCSKHGIDLGLIRELE